MIKTQEWNDTSRTTNYYVHKGSINDTFDVKTLIGTIWDTQQYFKYGHCKLTNPQRHTPKVWQYDSYCITSALSYRERCHAYPWIVPKELLECL